MQVFFAKKLNNKKTLLNYTIISLILLHLSQIVVNYNHKINEI